MNKNELIDYLSIDKPNKPKSLEQHFKCHLKDMHITIIDYNQNYFPDNNFKWKQLLYNYIHNIEENPTCKNENCNNKVNFYNVEKRYFDYCSNKCAQTSKVIIEKKKQTCLKNNNVEFPMLSAKVRKKSKESYKSHYGVDNPSKVPSIQEKKKVTSLAKYGVENYALTDEFKIRFKEINDEKLSKLIGKRLNHNPEFIEILDKDTIRIKNYCNKHDFFDIGKYNFYDRLNCKLDNICTKCFQIKEQSSIKELEVNDFIQELGFNTKKIKIKGKEIDIFIPEKNIGIEFNGIYFHSSKFKDKNYHLDKTKICNQNNIQLLHIFEDEWANKKDIVKSIIKSKLGIIDNKIYARKCEIKEIGDKELIRNFLNKNHIQGFIGSNYKIGLFYNNELVSLMTFGKKRLIMGNKTSKDKEYEMLRFCNKINTTVIGGASKMLKYFINKHKPISIISYADIRYSNGNLYDQLGFTKIKQTVPNYFYGHRHYKERKYRFNFRKDILIKEGYDKNKSEEQIMQERGYFRIYDCGSYKYELII